MNPDPNISGPIEPEELSKVRLLLEYEPETHNFWFKLLQPPEVHRDVILVMLARAHDEATARNVAARYGLQAMRSPGRIAVPPPGLKVPRNN